MAMKYLAVYDRCRGYVERFIKYTKKLNIQGIKFCGFSDPDILEESITGGRIEAVLCSQDENTEEGSERISNLLTKGMREKGLIVMILGEHPAPASEISGFNYIYKYQKAGKIIEKVLEITGCDGKDTDSLLYPGNLHIYGIYSPWEKQSHPETAVQVAKIISSRKESRSGILYINLEQFSGMSDMLDMKDNQGLSNVIYYFRTRPEQLPVVLRDACGNYAGMDVLTAPGNLEDLEEIDREEWPDFLESVSRAGNYQNIILDISEMYRQMEDMIFKYGSLYIPPLPYLNEGGKQDQKYRIKTCKMSEYRNYIKRTRTEDDMEKIFEIRSDAYR